MILRRFLPIPLLWLCLLTTMAQPGYNLKFKLSARDFADSIDIEYDGKRVFVPVSIGGEQLRFLLDTGAAQAVVYDDSPLAQCRQTGTVRSTDALGNEATVAVVELPPMQLGHLTFTGLHATVHQRLPSSQKIDGIVGFDIVCKGLSMKIDTRQKRLILTDRRKHFDAERERSFESRYEVPPFLHTPYVSVQPFRGYTEQALFDTGSPHLYRIGKKSFDQALDFCLAQNPSQIADTTTGSFARGLHGQEPVGLVTLLRLDSLSWGGFTIAGVETRTTSGFSHIGGQLLGHGAVVFLPHRKRLLFQPYNGQNSKITFNSSKKRIFPSVSK